MKMSIKIVWENINSLVEVCLCYLGDIIDFSKIKFDLQYYLDLVKRLEDAGVYIIVIKDMVGLFKFLVVEILIGKLKEMVDMFIYLYIYDISSIQVVIYMKVIDVGVDVIDVVFSVLLGFIFQLSFNVMVVLMQGYECEMLMDLFLFNVFSSYWEGVWSYYYLFEMEFWVGIVSVYEYEILGGQYFNL